MDLDDGQLDGGDRVAERDRVVRERAGVEDDAVEALALRRLEPVDELALEIRLAALDGAAAAPGVLADHSVALGERHLPVDPRLAGAEEVQIRPVQDEDLHDRRGFYINGGP